MYHALMKKIKNSVLLRYCGFDFSGSLSVPSVGHSVPFLLEKALICKGVLKLEWRKLQKSSESDSLNHRKWF